MQVSRNIINKPKSNN